MQTVTAGRVQPGRIPANPMDCWTADRVIPGLEQYPEYTTSNGDHEYLVRPLALLRRQAGAEYVSADFGIVVSVTHVQPAGTTMLWIRPLTFLKHLCYPVVQLCVSGALEWFAKKGVAHRQPRE